MKHQNNLDDQAQREAQREAAVTSCGEAYEVIFVISRNGGAGLQRIAAAPVGAHSNARMAKIMPPPFSLAAVASAAIMGLGRGAAGRCAVLMQEAPPVQMKQARAVGLRYGRCLVFLHRR